MDAGLSTLLIFLLHTILMRKRYKSREIEPKRFFLYVILYLTLYTLFVEGLYNFHWFMTEIAAGVDLDEKQWLIELFGPFILNTRNSLLFGIFLIVMGFPSFYIGSLLMSYRTEIRRRKMELIIIPAFFIYLAFSVWNFWYGWGLHETDHKRYSWLFLKNEREPVIYSWAVLFTFFLNILAFYLFGYLFGICGYRFVKKDLRFLFLIAITIYFLGFYFWDRSHLFRRVYMTYDYNRRVSAVLGKILRINIRWQFLMATAIIWFSYFISFLSANSLACMNLKKE